LNAIGEPTMLRLSFMVRCPSAGDVTRKGVGSMAGEKMGDEPAFFKTIRLCSIKAVLSNTITVVINRISPIAWLLHGCKLGAIRDAISGPGRRIGHRSRANVQAAPMIQWGRLWE
jgi:hypothetical protein